MKIEIKQSKCIFVSNQLMEEMEKNDSGGETGKKCV